MIHAGIQMTAKNSVLEERRGKEQTYNEEKEEEEEEETQSPQMCVYLYAHN